MDDLRSCYYSVMRLVPGDPTSDIPIIWYWAKPDAPRFESPHSFSSSNWDKSRDEGTFLIGEQPEQRGRWSNGKTHPSYAAHCQCGTDEEFLNGLTREVFDARDRQIPPPCCGNFGEILASSGGLTFGRTGYPRSYIPCIYTSGGQGAYLSYHFRIKGVANEAECAGLNGLWTINYQATSLGDFCRWTTADGPGTVDHPNGTWTLYVGDGYASLFTDWFSWSFVGHWTGGAPLTLTLDSLEGADYDYCPGLPTSITIYPDYPPYSWVSSGRGLRIGGSAVFKGEGGFAMAGGLNLTGAAIITRGEATSPITYESPGTYELISPYGVSSLHVTVIGGGAGGASGGETLGGRGGGGGGRAIHDYPATPGNSLFIVVGAGGLGGNRPGNASPDGTDGGDSTFYDGATTMITGPHGEGGHVDGGGGAGGSGTDGAGGSGDGASDATGAHGGEGAGGGAGGTGSVGAGSDGADGSYPGGGGQGGGAETSPGSGAGMGGNGADGRVLIEWS